MAFLKKNEEFSDSPPPQPAYVGFWARAWASFIDTILLGIVTYPLLIAIYGWACLDSKSLVQGPWDFFISWILPGMAIVGFWMAQSATPGKMLIGARIVDAQTGGKPTQGQLIRRYFGYVVSSIPLCIGFVWAAFDEKKQGWHDKMGGTVVRYTRDRTPQVQKTSLAKPIFIPTILIPDVADLRSTKLENVEQVTESEQAGKVEFQELGR